MAILQKAVSANPYRQGYAVISCGGSGEYKALAPPIDSGAPAEPRAANVDYPDVTP